MIESGGGGASTAFTVRTIRSFFAPPVTIWRYGITPKTKMVRPAPYDSMNKSCTNTQRPVPLRFVVLEGGRAFDDMKKITS